MGKQKDKVEWHPSWTKERIADTFKPNSWEDVIDFCKIHDVKPKHVFNWVAEKNINKTQISTMKIGCLLHDKLQLNKKKKKALRLSPRAVILNSRKEIIKLHKNKDPDDYQLYRIGDKALKRTWLTFKVDKESRKWLNEQ